LSWQRLIRLIIALGNTVIESKSTEIQKSSEEVYRFLIDLQNHQLIMPEQVINYMASPNECSYTINGTGNLSLKLDETITNTSITLIPKGKVPFDFKLLWLIEDTKNGCLVNSKLDAQMSFLIKAVAAGPLKNFLDLQIDGLTKHFS
jgi:carbon monoxide dehydrogenase subunit G